MPKTKTEYPKLISCRMKEADALKLEVAAKADGRPLGNFVRRILEAYLSKQK